MQVGIMHEIKKLMQYRISPSLQGMVIQIWIKHAKTLFFALSFF